MDILAPCAACYLILNKTERYTQDYPDIKLVVTRASFRDNRQIVLALKLIFSETDLLERHPLRT